MRKRSEAKPTKPSAADRTVPMQYDDPNAIVKCTTCEEESEVGKCSKKDNGTLECPACGAPIEGAAKPGVTKTEDKKADEDDAPSEDVQPTERPKKVPAFQPAMSETKARAMLGMPLKDAPAHEPPPKGYCAQCGAEAALVDGKLWLGCGHASKDGSVSFGIVDDPKKAANYGPPAGVPRAVVIGRTLHVSRGRHTFPTVAYGGFHVGPFSASAEVGPDANLVDVARSLRAQLKKIADEAFDEELEWYEQKLNRVKGED